MFAKSRKERFAVIEKCLDSGGAIKLPWADELHAFSDEYNLSVRLTPDTMFAYGKFDQSDSLAHFIQVSMGPLTQTNDDFEPFRKAVKQGQFPPEAIKFHIMEWWGFILPFDILPDCTQDPENLHGYRWIKPFDAEDMLKSFKILMPYLASVAPDPRPPLSQQQPIEGL